MRVGVAVFVIRDGQFLMGHRKGSHGEGTWTVPGGHAEFGESFEETAAREVLEETAVSIAGIRFVALTNDFFEEAGKQYACVWLTSQYANGEPRVMEPEKCLEWRWCDLDTLPAPLFEPAWNNLRASEFFPEVKRRLLESRHA